MKYFISILFLFIYFNTLFAQDTYYWVGGTGNWSDLNHWQLDNGSTPNDLPNETISVVFNENSFAEEGDSVIIDLLNVYCSDMVWENVPFTVWLTGIDTSILFIYGSLKFHSTVANDFQGNIHFDGIETGSKTIEPNGVTFNGEIRFQGINSDWNLSGDLTMNDSALLENRGKIVLEHGGFSTNGHDMYCSSFHSNYTNTRTLDIKSSTIHLYAEGEENCWDANMENLTLLTEGSTIIIYNPLAKFTSYNGNYQLYETLLLNGWANKIENSDGIFFRKIQVEGDFCDLGSNISADSVIINGNNCSIGPGAEINNLVVNAEQFSFPEGMVIKRLISEDHITIAGSNYIEYGKFRGYANFLGNNTFDTLILLPTYMEPWAVGSIFRFQSGTTQDVIDSLFIRGNPCSNITLMAIPPNVEVPYIKKDYGAVDVTCDFLNIQGVGAESETLNFYAGQNSGPTPVPPPGWIFEDPSNYLFGFQVTPEEPCLGDTVILDATNFNGGEETLYYWNGSETPGEITYEVTEPGNVSIIVLYTVGCFVADNIIIEFDSCENSINRQTINNLITIYPNPSNGIFGLNTQNLYGDFDLNLYYINGEMVFHDRVSMDGDIKSKYFDFSYLAKGIYYALISNKGNVAAKKIIIQ